MQAQQLETLAVQGGHVPAADVHGLTPPIHRSTAFENEGMAGASRWGYTRIANPTVDATAARLAALEGADDAVLLSSGTAAIAATLLGLLPAGGRIVAARELYGDTLGLIAGELPRMGFAVALVAIDDDAGWRRELARGADVVYVETLSNPMLRVAPIDRLARLAHAAGARAVADATFTTPVNLRPIEHGFDVVVHSATKYLNGHSDVVAGVVAGRRKAMAAVRERANLLGACLDPQAAYLLDRGLRTLALRMARHNAGAADLAARLERHPEVLDVRHPARGGHPDRAVADRLLDGGSGIVTIRVRGGDDRAAALMRSLRLVRDAPTLGGLETLVSAPSATSHCRLGAAERARLGILPGTLRLSVGIEAVDDVHADLERALAATTRHPLPSDQLRHHPAERSDEHDQEQRDDHAVRGRGRWAHLALGEAATPNGRQVEDVVLVAGHTDVS